MESFQRTVAPEVDGESKKTIFRMRLRRFATLNGEIQLRLFFRDTPGALPIVSGWTETGVQLYHSNAMGSGLDLPSSETVTIPVAGLDYLDITVPGDGSNLRTLFAATLKRYESRHALDFEPRAEMEDPFAGPPATRPSTDDSYLYGRVRAMIDPGPVKLSPEAVKQSVFEFDLESAPLLAVISFEALNVDPLQPPELTLNHQALGRVSIQLPDLADPAYHSTLRALESDMRFHYAGWVRCQQVVPGSALLSGLNKLVVAPGKESSAIAIRSVEIELKTKWKNLDYELIP